MNKSEQNQRLLKNVAFFILFTLALPLFLMPSQKAYAANVCRITNPAPGATVLPWLAPRPPKNGCASREHLGVDIMLATCTPVNNQQGCDIVMNGNSPLHKVGGYGYYMRYTCNPYTEVRYAHLRGYDADARTAIVGYSGAATADAPHIHYEVYVVDHTGRSRAVDPECVWGESDVATCCQGVSGTCKLGNGPADVCDPEVRRQLSENHSARATGGSCNSPPNGYTSMPIQPGVSPEQVPRGKHIPDDEPKDCGSSTSHSGTPLSTLNTIIDLGDETPENFEVTVDPGGEFIPGPEPGPGIPGTPGDKADLTPPGAAANDTGCAPDTWTAMVNQAVLEARREIIINNRLLAKSDSVLTYTCFDDQVHRAAEKLGPIFSETDYWKNRTVDLIGKTVTISRELGSDSLDGSLTMLVDQMAAPYLTQNFSHGLLGETAGSLPVSSGGCAVMNTIWQAAKCKNAEDNFYTFQELVTSSDPRNLPASLTCSSTPPPSIPPTGGGPF